MNDNFTPQIMKIPERSQMMPMAMPGFMPLSTMLMSMVMMMGMITLLRMAAAC
jgi:hypothetical protein